MKVTIDACVLGAWAPVPQGPCRVLDIGTGTGLLSLMIAQRAPEAMIDAVELDAEAAAQATENVVASPFADRVRVRQGNVLELNFPARYDLIVVNPPFFENQLRGINEARNAARHTNTLSPGSLAALIAQLLKPEGSAVLLLPLNESESRIALFEQYGLRRAQCLTFYGAPQGRKPRTIGIWNHSGISGTDTAPGETFVLYDAPGVLSRSATDLLRPFYLAL